MTSHKDCLGQKLEAGDYVAALFPDNETPHIFLIIGFTPKKIKVERIGTDECISKFPHDTIKLDPLTVVTHLDGAHLDHIGQKLEVGDYVFGSDASYIDPVIFKIVEFHPRKARLEKVMGSRSYMPNRIRLTTDLIKVDAKLLTMYKLTKGNDDEV